MTKQLAHTMLDAGETAEILVRTVGDAQSINQFRSDVQIGLCLYSLFDDGAGYPITGVDIDNDCFEIAGDHAADFPFEAWREWIYVSESANHEGRYRLEQDNPPYYDGDNDKTIVPVIEDLTDDNVNGRIVARTKWFYNLRAEVNSVLASGEYLYVAIPHSRGPVKYEYWLGGWGENQNDAYLRPDGGLPWDPDHGTYIVNDYAYVPEGDISEGYKPYGAWYKCKQEHSASWDDFPPHSDKWAEVCTATIIKMDLQGNILWTYDVGSDLAALARDAGGNLFACGSKSGWTTQQQAIYRLGIGGAVSGTYRLAFNNEWTAELGVGASILEIRAALHALPSVYPGDLSATGHPLSQVDERFELYINANSGVGRWRGLVLLDQRKLHRTDGLEYMLYVRYIGYTPDEDGGAHRLWKISPAGAKLWGADPGADLTCLDIDADGNVYVGASNKAADGNNVWKYNTDGVQQWGKYVPFYNDKVVCIKISPTTGDVYVAGYEAVAGPVTMRRLAASDGSTVWTWHGENVSSFTFRTDGEWFLQVADSVNICRYKEVWTGDEWEIQQVWTTVRSFTVRGLWCQVLADQNDDCLAVGGSSYVKEEPWDCEKFDGATGVRKWGFQNHAQFGGYPINRGALVASDSIVLGGRIAGWFRWTTQ